MAKDKNPLDPADTTIPTTTNGKTVPTALAVALTAPDATQVFETYRAFLRGGGANPKVWNYTSLEWIDFCNTNTGLTLTKQNQ